MPLHCMIKNAQKGWARVPKDKKQATFEASLNQSEGFCCLLRRRPCVPKTCH